MKIRKKTSVDEAVRWDGNPLQASTPEWFKQAVAGGEISFEQVLGSAPPRFTMKVRNAEGSMRGDSGDYVVREGGLIRVVGAESFSKIYEEVK